MPIAWSRWTKICATATVLRWRASSRTDQGERSFVESEKKGKNRPGWLHAVSILLVALNVPGAIGLASCGAGPEKHVAARRGQGDKTSAKEKRAEEEAKPYVLVGAGDIAACSVLAGAEATARLIEQIPGTVF